ncbi:NAD(P)/FAD-dependent oxidoreductase [Kordiimonas pumila]|uniref:NAD(P)/FAD-dependent oxidoreductase n=1 Tax=Kordiimonas pumila TaxID=2161677 RepID=A0ABV7D3W9_9PROT|nr:FAD-dependent oxidoreductase [Kordiimonas pumila]
MQADIIIVGGGIAGISAAYFISKYASVVVVERETAIGTHSSSRTAGQFTVGIYADTMRRLAKASRSFLETPPAGFADYPLLSPRGCLTVGRRDQQDKLDKLYDYLDEAGAALRRVSGEEALSLFPALRPENVHCGVYEENAMDIDVDLLLQSYAKGAKANGAKILTNIQVNSIRRTSGKWAVETPDEAISAPLLLNASGAWTDEVGKLAGLPPIGLTPCRRTAFTFASPDNQDVSQWPHVSNADYKWYLHPESHGFMGSPVDTVPTPPSDVYPDDMDVAQGIYNIEQDTIFQIRRPTGTWAGLRSFMADKNPVLGTRPDAEGFYWLAGHGGCGVLTSPALGQAAASLLLNSDLPEEQKSLGISVAALAPDRASLRV